MAGRAPSSTIEGTVADGRLALHYKEAVEHGSGWFRLRRPGCFAGEYLAEGRPRARPWQGWRGLDGLWDTSIGRLRLVEDGGQRAAAASSTMQTARLEGDSRRRAGASAFRLEGSRIKGRGVVESRSAGYRARRRMDPGRAAGRSRSRAGA